MRFFSLSGLYIRMQAFLMKQAGNQLDYPLVVLYGLNHEAV